MEKEDFLYQTLYDTLYTRIMEHQYPLESKLPSEAALKQEFGVSTITVKKAMGMLVEKGLIRRVPGRGSFVMPHLPHNPPIEAEETKEEGRLLGLVLEHVSTPFGLTMMYHLDQLAQKEGYSLCIRFSYGQREKETQEIEFLLSLGVSGLIIMPSHGRHYNSAILKLVLDQFPVILVDKKLKGIEVPSVRTDNSQAMETLVRHLAEQGCRNIGLISFDEMGATSLEERRKGFHKGISALSLPKCQECRLPVHENNLMLHAAEGIVAELVEYFRQEQGRLDAVVCAEYGMVPDVVQAMHSLGIVPDKDLRICCIDEDYLAPQGYAFTHMRQDEEAIAQKALSLLMKKLRHEEISREDYKIPAMFCERKPNSACGAKE